MAHITSFKGLGYDLVKVFNPTVYDDLGIKEYIVTWCLVNPKTHKVVFQKDNILDMLKEIERRLDEQIEIQSEAGQDTSSLFEDSYKFLHLVQKYHPAYNT